MGIFRDQRSYSLGKLGRLEIARGARDDIRALMMDRIGPTAARIASRCNESSSWGGYESRVGRQAAWVVATRGGGDRGKRILTAASGAAEL